MHEGGVAWARSREHHAQEALGRKGEKEEARGWGEPAGEVARMGVGRCRRVPPPPGAHPGHARSSVPFPPRAAWRAWASASSWPSCGADRLRALPGSHTCPPPVPPPAAPPVPPSAPLQALPESGAPCITGIPASDLSCGKPRNILPGHFVSP